jgi:tRNA nucleotidyltransferase/poly(A) polymerase
MSGLRRGADEVAAVLRAAGYEVFFAGGSVRDFVLGIDPKDYDLVSNARPEEVDRLFKRTVLVGAAFGVVRVLWKAGQEYEIATYRSDGAYSDGRRPDLVKYSDSKEEDVLRRDFTINALLMNPETDEVIDLVDGRRDLKAGLIKAVGEADRRFREDRLRMLRAIRFAARFGFTIEKETKKAICEHASQIGEVSKERIVMELHGIWTSSRPALGMSLMAETGLLASVFEFLPRDLHQSLGERYHRLSSNQTLFSLDERFALAWSVLLDMSSSIQVAKRLREFKLSRSLQGMVLSILSAKDKVQSISSLSVADRVRVVRSEFFELYLGFLMAIEHESESVIRDWRDVQADLVQSPLPPLPLVNGGDLAQLGHRPGPLFKKILTAVETEVFERRLTTKAEAITWIKKQEWR